MHCAATRNAVLQVIYDLGWVTYGPQQWPWLSKLRQIHLLAQWNPAAVHLFPKSLSLNVAPRDPVAMQLWLQHEFPDGYVIKPENGHSSGEPYLRGDLSHILKLSAQDEWLVQAIVGPQDWIRENEFRVHTFWHRVVHKATYSRWDLFWDDGLFREVESAVQAAMNLFPEQNLRGHAWGLDVIRLSRDRIVIVDINTNRGGKRQWSGDLSIPDALGAYVRHWEEHFDIQFHGPEGDALRGGDGNRAKWIHKVGQEAALRHDFLRSQRDQRAE